MNKLNDRGKLIISAVIVVVAVVLVIYYGSQTPPQAPGANNATSTAGTAAPSAAPSAAGGNTGSGNTGGSRTTGGTTPPSNLITFVTPIPGETWTIGTQNTIQWSRAGGVSGEIALLDATTKALVGVILPQTGPQQTSYAWNTRDIAISRTNPLKKNVVPGRYVIRVSWDGNNLPSITSQPITITQ